MKPLAWIKEKDGIVYSEKPDDVFSYIPLYALRELSEDEIKEVADSVCHDWDEDGLGHLYMMDFAKAILRKAQEK